MACVKKVGYIYFLYILKNFPMPSIIRYDINNGIHSGNIYKINNSFFIGDSSEKKPSRLLDNIVASAATHQYNSVIEIIVVRVVLILYLVRDLFNLLLVLVRLACVQCNRQTVSQSLPLRPSL